MNATHDPDDATLVAWLDGELDEATAAHVERAVAVNRSLLTRAELLRAARAELAGTFPRSGDAAPRRRAHTVLPWLLAAAALAIVIAIGMAPRDRDAVAANDALSLRLVPLHPAWDLFAAIRFELEGIAKTATPVRIVARNSRDETDAQLAERVAADASLRGVLPVVLDAEVTGPDGRARPGPVVRVEHTFTATTSSVVVELVDVVLQEDGVAPLVAFEMRPDGPVEGFTWGLQRVGEPVAGGAHGCVPDEPGEYRVTFTLRAFRRAGDHFGEPLTVANGFVVKGVAGPWSAPVDGLRARLVAPLAPPHIGAPLPFAVQLRNESDRARKYNVVGSTMAQIPTPFHFHVTIDDANSKQRGTAVTIGPDYTFVPQPPGTTRSIAMLADFWRVADEPLSQLRGRHRLGARFHFVPTLWSGDERELWQGDVTAPAIEVDFGPR